MPRSTVYFCKLDDTRIRIIDNFFDRSFLIKFVTKTEFNPGNNSMTIKIAEPGKSVFEREFFGDLQVGTPASHLPFTMDLFSQIF